MMAVGMPNVITYGIVWENPYRQEPVIVYGKLVLAQLVKFSLYLTCQVFCGSSGGQCL